LPRYALYYAPRPTESLHLFGKGWFGFDPESGTEQPYEPAHGTSAKQHLEIVSTPRHYALHGTLKPPFSLAKGMTELQLLEEVAGFARTQTPIILDPPALRSLSGFLAIVPSAASQALSDLAARCVETFDSFRAPASDAEIEKRRRAGLSDVQEENLIRWGYPYVMSEFRFHVTLTKRIGDEAALTLAETIAPRLEAVLSCAFEIRDVCVFIEPDNGAPMRLLQRFALEG